jgi:hypothetical protein
MLYSLTYPTIAHAYKNTNTKSIYTVYGLSYISKQASRARRAAAPDFLVNYYALKLNGYLMRCVRAYQQQQQQHPFISRK